MHAYATALYTTDLDLPNAERNVNVSQGHPRQIFRCWWRPSSFSDGGRIGRYCDQAVTYIDPELESELFASSPAQYDFEVEASSERTAFLQGLADELRVCMEMPYPITLAIAASPQINALALPGGHVVVFSGLIDGMSSENGLAFVLAHELAHFKHRDHLRGMGRGLVLVAASAWSVAPLGTDLNADSGRQSRRCSYSQSREAAADAAALELHCKYGDVGGAEELFRTWNK